MENIVIDGKSLTLDQVVKAARGDGAGRFPQVLLAKEAEERIRNVRVYIEEHWLKDGAPPMYGFNTGLGPLKDISIKAEENDTFQRLIVEASSAAFGEPADIDVARATMLLRANALAVGVSGVRAEVILRILDMLNRHVVPVLPSKGSVGASGDLAQLSHFTSCMTGHPEAEVFVDGERMPARDGLQKSGLSPSFQMKPKDVLGMINGCTFTLGTACLVYHDALKAMENAALACALSMEAMRGELAAYDERIHQVRNHPGQIEEAARVRRYLEGSERTSEYARAVQFPYENRAGEYKGRVQDAYALRCVPQVNGAARDVMGFVGDVLRREMNAATDNPLVFESEGGYEVLSGGNFHGEILAFAMDFLAIAVHEVGAISERRSCRLLDPNMSFGLPANLVAARVGLNTGFVLAQLTACSLVSENKCMCFPNSADSIPDKCNQEDYVSMATAAAQKARRVVDNVYTVIGMEYLCAAQGISIGDRYLEGIKLAKRTQAAYDAFRGTVPMMEEDRYMHRQMKDAVEMTRSGVLVDAANKV